MLFRCQLCRAEVMVSDDTSLITCQGCQAESILERRHGTIALTILSEPANISKSEEKKLTKASPLGQLMKELVTVKQESSTIRNGKIVLALAGGICGILFGYIGSISFIGKDFGVGVTLSVCAAGSFWFVRVVVRDSSTSARRIDGMIEEIEILIAERQKSDIQRMAAGLD